MREIDNDMLRRLLTTHEAAAVRLNEFAHDLYRNNKDGAAKRVDAKAAQMHAAVKALRAQMESEAKNG